MHTKQVTPFPTGPYGGNPGTTDWQVAYVMIARNMVLHYGAVTHPVLTELWPSLDLFMAYLDRHVKKKKKTSNVLTQNVLEDTDGVLRPLPLDKGRAPRQCHLGKLAILTFSVY